MNDNETIRWPTNLDRAAIESRLIHVRNTARKENLTELASLLAEVEAKPAAQLASAVIGALSWLDGKVTRRSKRNCKWSPSTSRT